MTNYNESMKKQSERKLNLGSGQFPKKGFINLDGEARFNSDVVHNLEMFPYPFPDNHFVLIEADHVLEHLCQPFTTVRELHRLLVPGGKLIIRVPHFSRGFTHADHKCAFDVTFPYYFRADFKGGYAGVEFGLKQMRLSWFAQPYLKKDILSPGVFYGMTAISWLLSGLANLSPAVCSRFWCYWVGGLEEIEFQLIAKKNDYER